MNPTLCDLLTTIAPHIAWAAGYDPRVEASTHIIINDIVLGLSVRAVPHCYWVTATISGHDRPHIRVSVGDRADLRTAWTEVAEVVARVDAAAGAAMGQPRESKADAQPKPYRTGDVVRHIPSGEEWLVADVTSTHIGCCGWPHTMAPFSDVELVEAATDEAHLKLLREMANMSVPDPRRSYAQEMLEKMGQPAKETT